MHPFILFNFSFYLYLFLNLILSFISYFLFIHFIYLFSSFFQKAPIKMNKLMALVPGGVRMAFAVVNEVVASPAELVFVVPDSVVVFVNATPIANKTSEVTNVILTLKVTNVILAPFKIYNFIKILETIYL
jgi:hypothetical protein